MNEKNYINNGFSLKSWLLTIDHKRIALLYLFSVTGFFIIGALGAFFIRLNLMSATGGFMTSETYNRLFTLHGVVMVFLFLIPAIPSILGNFLVPLMIGAKDLALPRINLLSWYLYMAAGMCILWALIMGGVDTGWTFYTPYSSLYSNTNVILTLTGIFIGGFSSIFTGLNFIVTIHKLRAPGLTWFRLPLFIWAHYATSLVIVLATPVVAIALALVLVEKAWGVGIFDPTRGGDPVLFQHLFWFYSHPAVYIMVLPAMGIISELIAAFCKKRIYGYKVVAYSSIAIAVIGFLVWGHHLFVTGQSVYAGIIFSFLSFLVAVPSAIKVFNWTATFYRGNISFDAPMYYAIGFIGLFAIGGLTGLFLSTLGTDVHLHDTYFVVAHFHYVMVGGTIIAYLGGIHYWWPKITGKLYPEFLAKISAIIIFVGFNFTFFPQFVAGYAGMLRRYHKYDPDFQVWNILSTAGSTILGLGYLMPLLYLGWSWKYGKPAGNNPWGAYGLEWETQSPPITENFEEIPTVKHEAYAYETMEAKVG
jgi:cytochrome c oxidase subunit 1